MIKERLRYQKNTVSYALCLCALLLNIVVLGLIMGYPPQINPTLTTGIDILAHIVFLMLAFLAAEKQKVYSVPWSYVGFGLAAFSLLRIFLFLLPYNKQGLMQASVFAACIVVLVVIGLLFAAAGVLCLHKAKILKSLPTEDYSGH